MATQPELTTEQGLRLYLEAQGIECKETTLLTGGTANYVYRVTLVSGEVFIYKHAAPYLHSNTNFSFDPSRMDYEHCALTICPSLLEQALPASDVHVVECYNYDEEEKLLCIEDGGNQNLKSIYPDPKLDIPTIGKELGKWLAALHHSTILTPLSLAGEQDLQSNNPIAVAIYRHSYNNLHLALAEFNHDPSLAKQINEDYGSKLATDNECICHGDFWPGNVLVRYTEAGASQLTIVDWEMVRRGTSATDVAQFAAEAFLLDRFKGGRNLRSAFLDAYIEARGVETSRLGKEWVKRVVVHWAVHIAFWPTRVEWTDREGTQSLVDIGVDALKAVVENDWEKLRMSEVFKDVSSAWDAVFNRP